MGGGVKLNTGYNTGRLGREEGGWGGGGVKLNTVYNTGRLERGEE